MTDTATTNGTTTDPVVANEDNLTVAVCERMAVVLAKAAAGVPLRGHRAAFLEQMNEWRRAAMDLEGAGDEGYIAFAGAIMPGQRVQFGERGWLKFVRHTTNSSLQLDDPMDSRPVYLSVWSMASPVLVQKREI